MCQGKMSKQKMEENDKDRVSEFHCDWDLVDVLSEKVNYDKQTLNDTINLLDEGNTVPFIARYRKEKTKNMEAETIREVKEEVDYLRTVQNKAASVYNAVVKLHKVPSEWKRALAQCQTLDDVDHLYAPYKPGSKGTLAERARELGLEPLAMKLITPPGRANLHEAVKPKVKGLSAIDEVRKGVQHIIADIISKHQDIMKAVRQWCSSAPVSLNCSRVKMTGKKKDAGKSKFDENVDASKFELYFDFNCPIKRLKPHQVLAINRGVSKKILTMKITIPEYIRLQLYDLARKKFIPPQAPGDTVKLINESIQDAYSRLIEPLMMRQFRSELTKMAEKASIDVFASNLKKLLLMPPVRGQVILGVDPGFKHGCKYAVISATGQVLDTGTFYPHTQKGHLSKQIEQIKNTMLKNRCEIVGIGNGTACRETESFFAEHIKRGTFNPLKVKFCIVNEAGASIYSASPEAVKELPDLDVCLRGAVSIARRLQDPLAELVKIEPKHIGVGMYQHDISDSKLKSALDGVVEDCVSFVGVDLNVASEALLKHIAGLSVTIAKNIIQQRESKGPFINREQLTLIKGLGPKTFKQCAGFIRVQPLSDGLSPCHESAPEVMKGKKRLAGTQKTGTKAKKSKAVISLEPNPLDMTSVHPESYHIADNVLSLAKMTRDDVGTPRCIEAVKALIQRTSLDKLAAQLDAGVQTLVLILEALQQELGHDIRDEFEKPLFREGLKQLGDLRVGDQLTGRVTNTVHFGAFVDVGVGRDGLIHSTHISPLALGGKKGLELGDKVDVTVTNVDVVRGRLGLKLEGLG